MARKQKTIYLNRTRRRKNKGKRLALTLIIGLSCLVGAGAALLPTRYRVIVDGEIVGEVEKKEYVDEALKTLETKLKQQYDTDIQMSPVDKIERVWVPKGELTDPNKLDSYLRAVLDIDLGFKELYIDGERIGIIESEKTLDELALVLKRDYFDDETVDAYYTNDIELREIYAKEADLLPMDELISIASKRSREVITYEVQPGDTLSGIANKLKIGFIDILKVNEGMTEESTLRVGDVINVEIRVPMLGMALVPVEEVEEIIEE